MSGKRITREEVLRIAGLARLELTQEEIEGLEEDLARGLEYMEMLNEADVGDIPPTFYTIHKASPMREDVPEKKFSVEEILKNAPEKKDGFIVVPRVIE